MLTVMFEYLMRIPFRRHDRLTRLLNHGWLRLTPTVSMDILRALFYRLGGTCCMLCHHH